MISIKSAKKKNRPPVDQFLSQKETKLIPLPAHKRVVPRMYNVLFVNPDGSTFQSRQEWPHSIIKLPIDPSTLSEEQRAERLKRRRPPTKVIDIDDGLDVEFDQRQYADMFRY